MGNLFAFWDAKRKKDKNGACVGSGCRVYGGEAPPDESGIESCAYRGKQLSSTPVLRLHAQREGVPFETINIQPQRQKPRSHSQPRRVPNLHPDQYPDSWGLNLTDRRVLRSQSGHI